MNKRHCKQDMIAVEYSYGDPYRYDGISEFNCLKCGYRVGRWTGKELKEGEAEPPFGEPRNITSEDKIWNL